MRPFSSTSLKEAKLYAQNAARLLGEAQANDDPLEVIQNRRDTLRDAEQEVEYFQCSMAFEGGLSLHDDELYLSDKTATVVLETGEPLEIFFGGNWQQGILGREPSGLHNFYFYNNEAKYIGLTADGKALDRRVRARVADVAPTDLSPFFPFDREPRTHVQARILAFLEDSSAQALVLLEGDPYLIGYLPDGRGIALVWGGGERILTWQLRNHIVKTASQRGIATPILVFAAANTAPLDEDLVRFYQLPYCLTSEVARASLQHDEEDKRV